MKAQERKGWLVLQLEGSARLTGVWHQHSWAHPDPQQHLEGCSKCAKAEKQEFANPLARSILLSSSSSPLSMTDSLVAVIRDSTSFNHKEHDNYTLSIAL